MRTTFALFAFLALATVGCGRPFEPATPSGFVDMGDRYADDEYRAATADGVVLGIRAFDNDPKGELAFWAKALENRMRTRGGYALLDRRDVKSKSGADGVQLRFGHDQEGEPYLYWVTLFVTDDRIFLLEAGGPKEEITREEARIEWSIANFEHAR